MNEKPKEEPNGGQAKEEKGELKEVNDVPKERKVSPGEEADGVPKELKDSLKEANGVVKERRRNSLKAEKIEKPTEEAGKREKGNDKENGKQDDRPSGKPDEVPNGKENGQVNEKKPDELGKESTSSKKSEAAAASEKAEEKNRKEENPRINSDEFDQAVELIRAHLKCIEKLQHVIVRNLYKEKTTSNSSMTIKLECSGARKFNRFELFEPRP